MTSRKVHDQSALQCLHSDISIVRLRIELGGLWLTPCHIFFSWAKGVIKRAGGLNPQPPDNSNTVWHNKSYSDPSLHNVAHSFLFGSFYVGVILSVSPGCQTLHKIRKLIPVYRLCHWLMALQLLQMAAVFCRNVPDDRTSDNLSI